MENNINPCVHFEELEKLQAQFESSLFRDFSIDTFNKRLKQWYRLEWADFKKEILKTGARLTYPLQASWENYFNSQKERVLRLLQ